MTDPWVPAVIEMGYEALMSYFMIPASEPNLTNPEDIQNAIRGLKVSKASGLKGILNMALMHLPQRAVSLLVLVFNAILITHHSVEARSNDLYTENGEGSSTGIILSAQLSSGRDS